MLRRGGILTGEVSDGAMLNNEPTEVEQFFTPDCTYPDTSSGVRNESDFLEA